LLQKYLVVFDDLNYQPYLLSMRSSFQLTYTLNEIQKLKAQFDCFQDNTSDPGA